MSRINGVVALCVLALLSSGCGGSKTTGTVTGKITKDGKPIAAQISFKGESSTASAVSDPSTGVYTLRSGPSTEIPTGVYQVAVLEVSEAVDTQGADYAKMMEGGAANTAPKDPVIPVKYNAFGTSGLEFTITEGENTCNIELE